MGGDGGAFTDKSRAGLSMYQAFRKQNPGLRREELSALWQMHKASMGSGRRKPMGRGPIGGFPGQRAVFNEIAREHPGLRRKENRMQKNALFEAARKAYYCERCEEELAADLAEAAATMGSGRRKKSVY